ncbi:MAG: hypothetical protein M1350_02270 [Actinobacteria bacterium]|nr:hypothetical protein [Actinomycetota bacterium]
MFRLHEQVGHLGAEQIEHPALEWSGEAHISKLFVIPVVTFTVLRVRVPKWSRNSRNPHTWSPLALRFLAALVNASRETILAKCRRVVAHRWGSGGIDERCQHFT